jgi:hypothetical protein
VAYQGADSVVRDLESGRIDGAVLSGMMADYSFLQQPQGKDFAFVGGHLQDDKLFGAGAAIGLRKGMMRCVRKLTARSRRFSPTAPIKNCRVNILALTSIPGHNVVMHPAGTAARRKIPFLTIHSWFFPARCGLAKDAEYKR